MLQLSRDHVIYSFDKADTPVAYTDSGVDVSFSTYDCYNGNLLPEGNTFANVDRRFGNPATGPLYIRDAAPGDMLKIYIRKIECGPVGILDIGPTSGALSGIFPEPIINRIPVSDGFLTYQNIKVPIKPMIGVIGTAPVGEPVKTMTPMNHGGNMDCTKITEGATLYLPVFVKGGLLSTGDFHAIMGDGEVANCGLEIEGRAEFHIDVVKQTGITFPMVENETQWITIAYGNTLDEASDKAVKQMFYFLCHKLNLSKLDAGMLIDMAGDLIICQIVNPYKTVRMEIPKWMADALHFQ